MHGKVERIYISPQRKAAAERVTQARLEAGKGIVNDRYYLQLQASKVSSESAPINQLTLIAQEQLDAFLEKHDVDIDYGDFRRSIVTSGIDLNNLVGQEFRIGSIRCRGTELCEPCAYLAGSVHSAVLPDLVHKGGIRAMILNDGTLIEGDVIEIL